MEEHDLEKLRPDDISCYADAEEKEEEQYIQAKDDVGNDAEAVKLVGQLVEQNGGDARAHDHAEPAWCEVHGDAPKLGAEALRTRGNQRGTSFSG